YIPSDHATSQFAPFDLASRNTFIPQPSQDSALTSFAQLGATRLGTQRALISLFDRTHQHVIAEATPTLSLNGGIPENDRERLRLGSCVLPKESGLCHHVERLPSSYFLENSEVFDGSALVILDVNNDERFKAGRLHYALSDVRFYAAVPIVSPRGVTIGAYCIMDSEMRMSGLPKNSLHFMKDMAATVMKHLVMGECVRKSSLAERMMLGLGSFVDGKSTLRDSWREANRQHAASGHTGEQKEGQLNIQQQDIQESARQNDENTLVLRELPKRDGEASRQPFDNSNFVTDRSQEAQKDSTQLNTSIRIMPADEDLQENSLSTNIEIVFSRAANLIRESIGAEGVMFLDADSARFGSLVDGMSSRVSDPGAKDLSSDESTNSGTSPSGKSEEPDNTSLCACLGFSSSRGSSINNDSVAGREILMQEPLLKAILQRYPHGKIFSYNAERLLSDYSDGSAQKSTNSQLGGITEDFNHNDRQHSSSQKKTLQRDAEHLIRIFPDARNILILPVWDSDKRRITAGTLVWTNDPRRIFTIENELVYISAFTNSIMAQIRRLDVEMADKAKSNLISSITHELRTPPPWDSRYSGHSR
ncbi:hypothetical protein N7481_003715, partial [Penicillium waksmanii]|uniref:uncharacterized protein n=1 Tax=Penicillium waksmanii TaxID=69791 RepID=UPI002548E192